MNNFVFQNPTQLIFGKGQMEQLSENVDRFARFATEVWGVNATGKSNDEVALAGIEAVRHFFDGIGAPNRLTYYHITEENFELMAEKAVPFGPIGNFKKLNKDDVYQILKMSL